MSRWSKVLFVVLLLLVTAMALRNFVLSTAVAHGPDPVPPTPLVIAGTGAPVPPTPWGTGAPVPPTPWGTGAPVPPTPWSQNQ